MTVRITPGPYKPSFGPNQMPLFFGEDEENMVFGWYHSPDSTAENSRKDVGVVLCNPFGFEEVAAHRGIRSFALECSALGFPCVRFDYLGCGNSAQDEFKPDQVADWIESIRFAIETTKHLGGVEKVVLVGFRFGFSLAAIASVDRQDVLAMVAVSPVIRGRDYLRELRLLTSFDENSSCDLAGIALAPNGFIVSKATAVAIQKIDLGMVKLGTNKLHLIEELRISSKVEKWLQTVQSTGTSIDTSLADGYLQLASDPQTSTTPRVLFDRILQSIENWGELANDYHVESRQAAAGLLPNLVLRQSKPCNFADRTHFPSLNDGADQSDDRSETALLKESIVTIPAGPNGLFGLLTEQDNSTSQRAVVILNAGAVRNIGPNRMFVLLAKAWAEKGYRVLRLDFSGIGDSQDREIDQRGASYAESVAEELIGAVEFLRQQGCSEITLVGLCSGAYHAFRGLVSGMDVQAAILINPLAFDPKDLDDLEDKTFATYEVLNLFANIKRQIFTRKFWSKLRKGQLDTITLRKLVIRRIKFSIDLVVNGTLRMLNLGRRSDFVENVRSVLSLGNSLQFYFSESDPGLELLVKRSGKTLAEFHESKNFGICLIPDADHTFTKFNARTRLIEELIRLLQLEHPTVSKNE
ncbi:MAG: hypothetical protein NXH95_00280 [Pseudomonadaceae bacterium]|nr:hypothetical protein [Pseudomonadaceae bacterium]